MARQMPPTHIKGQDKPLETRSEADILRERLNEMETFLRGKGFTPSDHSLEARK